MNIFFRRCGTCGDILRFKEKNKIEAFDCFCKTCRRYKKMNETKDF